MQQICYVFKTYLESNGFVTFSTALKNVTKKQGQYSTKYKHPEEQVGLGRIQNQLRHDFICLRLIICYHKSQAFL